jgi:hypothetical protein
MTNAELDTMWFQAQHDAIKAGEDFTRYRFAALVAAAERKQYEHTLKLQQASYEREIKIEVEAEREKVAHWMRSMGYATGHGDTVEDLLDHLGTQIAEGLLTERTACADICDQHASIEGIAQRCAAEIRARGNT